MTIRFVSLFSGIGGIDLGLERAGMTCAAQVEIDDFCQKVLKKHWPNVPKFRDVCDVGKHNLPPVELICGGFPCQPHSRAGKQHGKADDRNLWGEYCRIIDELSPAWVFGENVVGIKETILDEVLSDLESRDYQTATFVIPACAFNAPHIRERVFVLGWNVAYSQSGRCGFFNAQDVGQAHSKGNAFTNGGEVLELRERNPWQVEPELARVADGIPDRVDRVRAIGNSVVPQVIEFIGLGIIASDAAARSESE